MSAKIGQGFTHPIGTIGFRITWQLGAWHDDDSGSKFKSQGHCRSCGRSQTRLLILGIVESTANRGNSMR